MGFFGGKKAEHAPAGQPQHRAYGIDDAIKLMRTLPAEGNSELVVRVVKNTLESVDVHLADIIQDAAAKQKHIVDRVTALQQQITELESEIRTRREEISRLQADLDETSSVKERLEHVEAMTRPAPSPAAEPSGQHDTPTGVAVRKTG